MNLYAAFHRRARLEAREDCNPSICRCGSTEFQYDKGFSGSQEEPPEPEGWYCIECDNREFDQ